MSTICYSPNERINVPTQEKAKNLDIHCNGLAYLLDKNYDCKTKIVKISPIKGEEDDIILLKNLFTNDECDKLVSETEKLGYSFTQGFDKKVRSNQRRRTIDPLMSEAMFNRIKPYLPQTIIINDCKWILYDFLDYWRYCKYDSNQHFSPHYDGSKMLPNYIMSMYTVNIYLNDQNIDFKGGNTRFYMNCKSNAKENDLNEANQVTDLIASQKGSALIFNHCTKGYLHDGQSVMNGKKYIMRADLLYKCENDDIPKLKKMIENEKNIEKSNDKNSDNINKKERLFYDWKCADSHTVINYVGRKWKCACVSDCVTVTLH